MACPTAATVHWLDSPAPAGLGVTFGLPWQRGICPRGALFACRDDAGKDVALQSWTTAVWPDGSAKWTAHALCAAQPSQQYHVELVAAVPEDGAKDDEAGDDENPHERLTVYRSDDAVTVATGRLVVSFPTSGPHVVRQIRAAHGVLAQDGRLVLQTQTQTPTQTAPAPWLHQTSHVTKVDVESGPVRALVTVHCTHAPGPAALDVVLRFHLYAGSAAVRVLHTLTLAGDPTATVVRGIGIRFDVPLAGSLHDRHVRLGGVDGGVLAEAVQGITGLWRDPGAAVRQAQREGRPTPPTTEWNDECARRLRYVPAWGDYRLQQLSPDGFLVAKRTGPGHAWVNIPGGTRASGLAFVGAAVTGGLAVGQRYFWERYPTGVDVRGATGDVATLTSWLYSPAAPAMDLRPYHDGLGQTTYEQQLDALQLTYEDWEAGQGTARGIARTNELLLVGVEGAWSAAAASAWSDVVRTPPVLVATRQRLYESGVVGGWVEEGEDEDEDEKGETKNETENDETKNGDKDEDKDDENKNDDDKNKDNTSSRLRFLFHFYHTQIQQRRWFGFWDHGDIMHTYDADRHTWRYDVGGYAWDNSELSPDLWLWHYFLATGRPDVFRLAEALTRHTSEVDAYHTGPLVGLGTRHGVQHWSDSCKQARVANAFYRRLFYYLSGGDERTGVLLDETLHALDGLRALDPYRKIHRDRADLLRPPPPLAVISLGTDWSALAAAWFVEYERQGPRAADARQKLVHGMAGIARLRHGFVTGFACFDPRSGAISPPPHDPSNAGVVRVSHLSAMFGLVEVCAALLEDESLLAAAAAVAASMGGGETAPEQTFEDVWLDYCRYFNAPPDEQRQRYGVAFGRLQLRQGHSRLTAYAAHRLGDRQLAARAWLEFADADGYGDQCAWREEAVAVEDNLTVVTEAPWISTNLTALYGLAALQNMAWAKR